VTITHGGHGLDEKDSPAWLAGALTGSRIAPDKRQSAAVMALGTHTRFSHRAGIASRTRIAGNSGLTPSPAREVL
jgi:hypothetical protein